MPALLQRAEDTRRLYPLKVVGIVGDIGATELPEEIQHWPIANDLKTELEILLQTQHYDEVILAEGSVDDEAAIKVQEICGRELIDFALLPESSTLPSTCSSLILAHTELNGISILSAI